MSSSASAPPVRVLYATETGNALAVAERVVREVEARGGRASLASMEDYDTTAELCGNPHEGGGGGGDEVVVFVASTCGQGEPPVSMRRLWKALLRRALQADALKSMHIAVFGLGDSAYVNSYNVVAKKLYRRLLQLGAEPIVALGLGDDQAPGGYDVALDPWLEQLWMKLRLTTGTVDPDALLGKLKVRAHVVARDAADGMNDETNAAADDDDTKSGKIEHKKQEWTMREAADASAVFVTLRAPRARKARLNEPETSTSATTTPTASSLRPFEARVVDLKQLSTLPDREVLHVAMSTEGSGISFRPGDLLAVLPRQNPADVERLCARLGLNADDCVELASANTVAHLEQEPKARVKLAALIDGLIDVNSGSPRRFFFQMLAQFTPSDVERERLGYFATTTDGREDLYRYNERERRTLLEVLDDFPEAMPPIEWVLEAAPRLRARLFSISNSPRVSADEAHITAAVVRVTTPYKRQRSGLCTSYLSSLKIGDYVPVWVETGGFHPPNDNAPLILVGPGTGVAPFRSFVQDIHGAADCVVSTDEGSPPRPLVLFFGCRNRDGDYLYGDEWDHRAKGEAFTLYTAFSRDSTALGGNGMPKVARTKTYVTHRIREAGAMVWSLLANEGAHIFVSGSSTKMPGDVFNAFVDVARTRGGFASDADARSWMKTLERVGRYHVESWS